MNKTNVVLRAVLLLWGLSLYSWTQVLFRPKDDIREHLLQYIMKEAESIHCAMYVLSDKKIAQELINAHERGVEIHLIIDQYSWDSSFGKGRFLKANGVSFLVYAPDNHDYLKALMHAKIFVFKSLGLAWSGSYNCTQSASVKNLELVTVTDEKNVLESFLEFYHLLETQLDMKRIEPPKDL